jgi:hypothetical protein
VGLPRILKPESGVSESSASNPREQSSLRDVVSAIKKAAFASMFTPKVEIVVSLSRAIRNRFKLNSVATTERTVLESHFALANDDLIAFRDDVKSVVPLIGYHDG